MHNNDIDELTIHKLLSSQEQYIIPIYQRNYAWEAKEIEQLIQDVIDAAISRKNENYYIGTLVVSPDLQKPGYYQTIDGQQRLTTLSILTAAIKNGYPEIDTGWFRQLNLHYYSRKKSADSMQAIFEGTDETTGLEANLILAYRICVDQLKKKCEEHKLPIGHFSSYLFHAVKILRVSLPEGIDLNHYFEIMNNRGEQLEKHEIVKARLMEAFNNYPPRERNAYSNCFQLIWEACSNMEKYVQYGFQPDERGLVFGPQHWNSLALNSFDEIVEKLSLLHSAEDHEANLSIHEIIGAQVPDTKQEKTEESPDRFNTVVNFPNFLLHVLRIQTTNHDIALDDKNLIDSFEKQFPPDGEIKVEFVKEFIYNLLKCKFLFDKYIIKREFTGSLDRWSLKCLKWYSSGNKKNAVQYTNTFGEEQDTFDSDNRRILMLLSMFHVSIPSMSYKYWLYAILNYLFHQYDHTIEAGHYIAYLEHIAKAFVFDRYLTAEEKDYPELICQHLHPIKREPDQLAIDPLRFGQLKNNLVFNFLDYLLWSSLKDLPETDSRVKSFEYTFRSSVEHYYPQTLPDKNFPRIDDRYLHSIGNLCLISHEKNSSLGNRSPKAKQDYYRYSETIDSIQQHLMMAYLEWGEKEIALHEKKTIDVLTRNMNSNFQIKQEFSLARKWFKTYQTKDKSLLIRALLCFGDFSRFVAGDRYQLFDFEYIEGHETFTKFDAYVKEKSPQNLRAIIEQQLSNTELKTDYRYFFIKYPEVIEYCKEGNFKWYDNHEGNFLYLLEGASETRHKARETYTFILQKKISQLFRSNQYCDRDGMTIYIGYTDQKYFLTQYNDSPVLKLLLWNEQGKAIHHCVEPIARRNSNAIKQLEDYHWQKNDQDNYERLRNPKLLSLGENYEENISSIFDTIIKLLKNGFGINTKN